MPEVVDYIMANYVWFVVGSVIIIMAIIGYFADKKGFGKPKPKDKDKDQVKVEESKDKEDNKEKVESVANETNVIDPAVKEEKAPVEPVVTEPTLEQSPIEEAPLAETNLEETNVSPITEPVSEEAPAMEPVVQDETVTDITPVVPINESDNSALTFENNDNQVPVIENLSGHNEDKPMSFDASAVPEVEKPEVTNNASFDEEPNAFMPTDDLTSTNDNLTDEEDIWKF